MINYPLNDFSDAYYKKGSNYSFDKKISLNKS